MELVTKRFILQTQLTGSVKITHFNARHVCIDLVDKFYYKTVWTKLRMNIEGHVMRIQIWTPYFTLEEDTPIVPIWVAITRLILHCLTKCCYQLFLVQLGLCYSYTHLPLKELGAELLESKFN